MVEAIAASARGLLDAHPDPVHNRAVISLAARVGKTRLIDNVLLGMEVSDLR